MKDATRCSPHLLASFLITLQYTVHEFLLKDLRNERGQGQRDPQLVIWGTDVIVNQCKEKFRRFIEEFVGTGVDSDEQFDGMNVDDPLYLQRLDEVGCFI